MLTEIKSETGGVGQIQIADEVIAIIAGTAALEVDGIAGMAGNFTDITEILGRKNLSKGVKVQVDENEVRVDVNIMVKFGYKIQVVAFEVQKRVKTAIETMTGLEAGEVNVYISGVFIEKKQGNLPHMDNE